VPTISRNTPGRPAIPRLVAAPRPVPRFEADDDLLRAGCRCAVRVVDDVTPGAVGLAARDFGGYR
jgi:hypothetical protein